LTGAHPTIDHCISLFASVVWPLHRSSLRRGRSPMHRSTPATSIILAQLNSLIYDRQRCCWADSTWTSGTTIHFADPSRTPTLCDLSQECRARPWGRFNSVGPAVLGQHASAARERENRPLRGPDSEPLRNRGSASPSKKQALSPIELDAHDDIEGPRSRSRVTEHSLTFLQLPDSALAGSPDAMTTGPPHPPRSC
jgi:hypothetical protein